MGKRHLTRRQFLATAGFHQRVLLGTKNDMDDIYNAILKIYENREKLSSL